MSLLSISKASRITGKSRTTLLRHIEQGKLSKSTDSTTGRTGLDTSELMRVYGELSCTTDTNGTEQKFVSVVHDITEKNVHKSVSFNDEIYKMKEKIAVLETENRMQKNLLEEKDKRNADLKIALALLEDKTKEKSPTKKKWWKLF